MVAPGTPSRSAKEEMETGEMDMFEKLKVQKVELRHCAKFSQNRSKLRPKYGDFSIFSRWRPPPSWMFDISNF